jgi:Sulfotransferase family
MAVRARLGEERFLDVHHRELAASPVGTLRRIYEWLGLEWRAPVERAVLEWQNRNRSGAHGTHRYTAEQFGLSPAQLRSDYDFYIRHFGVAIEA